MLEHKRATDWMQRNGMDRFSLADKIGYTAQSVYWFLRGATPKREGADGKIKPWTWQRFKRTCGDVDAELNGRKRGERFDW